MLQTFLILMKWATYCLESATVFKYSYSELHFVNVPRSILNRKSHNQNSNNQSEGYIIKTLKSNIKEKAKDNTIIAL